MGSSLNQRAAEFSLCNTPVLLTDLSFKQHTRDTCADAEMMRLLLRARLITSMRERTRNG